MTSKGDVHVVVGPKVESTGWYRTSLDMHFKLVKQEIRVHIRIFSPSGTTTPRSFHVVARHLWEPRAGTAAKIWKTAKAAARNRCNKCMVLHVENAALLYHSLKQACAAGALVQDPLMGPLCRTPRKCKGHEVLRNYS